MSFPTRAHKRSKHAAHFSAGAASTQICAAAQAHLCAACEAAVVRRSRQVEITQHMFFYYAWPSRDLARIHRILIKQQFRIVHFLFTFSNRCELVFPPGLERSAGRVAGWRCGSGKMGSGHLGHFDETRRTGSTEDGLRADAAHVSLATLCRMPQLHQTRTSFPYRATCCEICRGYFSEGLHVWKFG